MTSLRTVTYVTKRGSGRRGTTEVGLARSGKVLTYCRRTRFPTQVAVLPSSVAAQAKLILWLGEKKLSRGLVNSVAPGTRQATVAAAVVLAVARGALFLDRSCCR